MTSGFQNSPSSGFAERLESLLRGRSAEDVSQAIGVAPSTVRSWRAGKTQPKLGDLVRLARHLDTSVEFLAEGVDKSTATSVGSPDIDTDLLTLLVEGVRVISERAPDRLSVTAQARIVAETYTRVVAATENPVERRGAAKFALDQVERDLAAISRQQPPG